ncbi:nucleotidyltransferase family protein [Rudaeicoccus suwonensis]|uniref:Putative nucleotidyltransferase-like protein n=1 Tax=Rudaeicoccus suwonensis TaxID=657409 RepID=A0A561E8N4_9MICO|nr:nucleotidyltransferase family protein [Rudaeicoccus suwonensis]TWE11982.1 putative nucleotidyltransferase-like protein [Rudaeicoccus suwonensis]
MDRDRSADTREIPVDVRVQLVHGYAQLLASASSVDLLHLKGAAADPTLRPRTAVEGTPVRVSFDVDLLVRPGHVDRLLAVLLDHEWEVVSGFEAGSAFGHATTLRHTYLGYIDLHRSWPGFGMDADRVFDRLWAHRSTVSIAHVRCTVPSLEHQRLILMLHAGRSGGLRHPDAQFLWVEATDDDRVAMRGHAAEFDAQVALAAATGELEDYRDDPQYQLWRHFSEESQSRLDEWVGRWRAARSVSDRVRVVKGFLIVNPDLLRDQVGPKPSAGDYARAYAGRLGAAVTDLRRLVAALVRRR